MNKVTPSVPIPQRHGYRTLPPEPFLIPSIDSPDWVLRKNLVTHPISILQTKIPYDWILNCATNKSMTQLLITNRWIGVSANNHPLLVIDPGNISEPSDDHMPPAPVINIVDDQSTTSGFSDPMDNHMSSDTVSSP